MASEIAHIVAADTLFDKYFSHLDRKQFFIGTVFPDIRKLGEIDRSATHRENLAFDDVASESNSFRAGILLHSLFDSKRSEFLVSKGMYNWYPYDFVTDGALKLLEDEWFYDRVSRWPQINSYFDEIPDEERLWDVAEASLWKWHVGLQDYFRTKPDEQSRERYRILLNTSVGMWEQITDLMEIMRKDARVIETEELLVSTIENVCLFQNY